MPAPTPKLLTATATLLSTLLALVASGHPAARWRLDALYAKTTGRWAGLPWLDILPRLGTTDPDTNGGRWVLGSARLTHFAASGPCPATFSTPYGEFRGGLYDEFDLEHQINKYLGLGMGAHTGLLPTIEPGDTVVELGPWLGSFTRYALSRGAQTVIALEPAPENIECFRKNFAEELENGRVRLLEAAAWHTSGTVRITREGPTATPGASEGYAVDPTGDIEVRSLTLDDALSELGVDHIDVLNLDIEGAERHALAGAKSTIQRDLPQIVVCLHHLPDDATAIKSVMSDIAPNYELRTDNYHARYQAPPEPEQKSAARK